MSALLTKCERSLFLPSVRSHVLLALTQNASSANVHLSSPSLPPPPQLDLNVSSDSGAQKARPASHLDPCGL